MTFSEEVASRFREHRERMRTLRSYELMSTAKLAALNTKLIAVNGILSAPATNEEMAWNIRQLAKVLTYGDLSQADAGGTGQAGSGGSG